LEILDVFGRNLKENKRELQDLDPQRFRYVCYDDTTLLNDEDDSKLAECNRVGRWLQRPDIVDTLLADS